MALHYILGGPGTGKTTKLIGQLIESAVQFPDRRHIILVPEQYTMQTQRDVVRMHPMHAVMNIDILSFERLAYRVLSETGQEDIKVLSNMGKNMMLRHIAEEHKDELTVFRRNFRKPGFIQRLMNLLSEFYQYGISDDQLLRIQEQTKDQPILNRKLQDLQIFFDALNQKKEDAIAAEELLVLLLRQLPQSTFMDDAVVAMDYFTGFTPVQYQIIKKIMGHSHSVQIALTLPKREWRERLEKPGEDDLFHMSQSVIYTMNALAGESGISWDVEFLQDDRRHKRHGDLAYLTDHLMQYHGEQSHRDVEDIRAVCLRNPRQEAEYAAMEIRRLVKDEGLRYREIAVVTGDIEEYRPYLQQSFSRYDIPAFMDRKKGVLGNPLVEFLRSAMAVITGDFFYEDVFRFLRCGIPMMDPERVDRLDNYCLSGHIRGRKSYESEWEFDVTPEELTEQMITRAEDLNESRAQLLHILAPLTETRNLFVQEEDGKHRITVKERTQALRQLMEANQVGIIMEQMVQHIEESGYSDLYDEYRLIYEYILDLLNEMDELLGETALSLNEFSDIFEAGLAEAKLGVMPSSLDLVQVGDVMRSRLSEIKILILLGFNDGVIPGNHVSGGILTEQERMQLESLNLILAPAAEHLMNQERFYLYRLLTRPSDQILITCSRMNMKGDARKISYLWNQLTNLFAELRMEDGELFVDDILIESRDQAWNVFAGNMQALKESETEKLLTVGEYLRTEEPERMEQLVRAAFVRSRTDTIDEAVAAVLYGENIHASVTRLEQYAACAYAHFLTYGLRLAERDTGAFTGANRGSFFHRTLELFFRICREKEISYQELSDEERRAFVEEAASRSAEERIMTNMESSASHEYLRKRWGRLADRTIWAICNMLDQEDFIPAYFELYFDGENTEALRFPIGNEHEMILHGIVDRLDVYEEEDKRYLRVVDYKTGDVKLDLNQIYQGHQLQLPLYLNAVMEYGSQRNKDKTILPGGIYYYHLDDPMIPYSGHMEEETIQEELLKKLRMNGLTLKSLEENGHQSKCSGDSIDRQQFLWLCEHVRKKAVQFGEEIRKGHIEVRPYYYKGKTGCDYCAFTGVCGFNSRRKGNIYKTETEIKKKDLWKMFEEENHGSAVDSGTEESN